MGAEYGGGLDRVGSWSWGRIGGNASGRCPLERKSGGCGGDELLGIGELGGGKDTVKLLRKLLFREMENGLGAAVRIPRMGVD